LIKFLERGGVAPKNNRLDFGSRNCLKENSLFTIAIPILSQEQNKNIIVGGLNCLTAAAAAGFYRFPFIL